jgi:uncharacterized iron-regulated protein
MEEKEMGILWKYRSFFLVPALLAGCAGMSKKVAFTDIDRSYGEGVIVSSRTGATVTFDELLEDLLTVRIVYVGEQHTNPHHHAIQLRIIRALHDKAPDLVVGMEMFDATYQDVLDAWSSGALDRDSFLKKTHWYANWRYPFELYADILDFVRENRIRLVGLNIPFHLPAKISIGGIETLSEEEKRYLPRHMDTTHQAHRAYVEKIFREHRIKGREDFESFYTAQTVWEEAMAEAAARSLEGTGKMVVLAGNGHIVQKFGIPQRAFARTQAPYRTVYPASVGSSVDLSVGDYVWVTPAK